MMCKIKNLHKYFVDVTIFHPNPNEKGSGVNNKYLEGV